MRNRRAVPFGLVGIVASVVGWILEWYRQRGTCEFGDNSPDTLVASVLLVVLGGGLVGLASVVAAVVGMVRHGFRSRIPHLTAGLVSVASVVPVFLFAGAGPGSWFQYCAT